MAVVNDMHVRGSWRLVGECCDPWTQLIRYCSRGLDHARNRASSTNAFLSRLKRIHGHGNTLCRRTLGLGRSLVGPLVSLILTSVLTGLKASATQNMRIEKAAHVIGPTIYIYGMSADHSQRRRPVTGVCGHS